MPYVVDPSSIVPTPPGDTAPTAVDDTATVQSGGTVVVHATANDIDPDDYDKSPDFNYVFISEYSTPVVDGQALPDSAVTVIGGDIYFTADNSLFNFDSGTHTVTLQYKAIDTVFAESQNWATMTITVTGLPTGGGDTDGGSTGGGSGDPGAGLDLNKPNYIAGDDHHNDSINGGNQNDTLLGYAGADTLSGDNGQDSLSGGAGGDLLLGGNGKDTLDGGSGDDTLTGGNSPDTFVVGSTAGHVVITDFDTKNDTVQVSGFLFGGYNDLMAHGHNDGHGNVVFETDDHLHSLTLQHLKLSQLSAGDFIFTG